MPINDQNLIVERGPATAAGTVVVLDPAGGGVHDELPATWRSLSEQWHVVWCRQAGDGSWRAAEQYLDDVPAAGQPVDVVAAGPSVAAAMTLADGHRDAVRSLLLVDPAAGEWPVDPGGARGADELWKEHEKSRIEALEQDGVRVRVVAHSWEGPTDRIGPPLPLGHPAVVGVVRAALQRMARSGHPEHRLAELLDRPSRWPVLDKPAAWLRDAIERALPQGKLRDALHGTWLGHPVHPALAQVPLGMFISAGVLDLIPGAGRTAGALIGTGVLASIPTAVAGAADYTQTSPDQRRVGVVHAVLNTAALGCYVSSLWSRVRGRHLSAKASAYLGLALGGTSAALGGSLAYRHATGVNHAWDVNYLGPAEWTDLGPVEQYGQRRPVRRALGEVPVLVVRDAEEFHVLADRCGHASGPLSEGTFDWGGSDGSGDKCVRCPWHGSVFRLDDGEVLRGPATSPQPVFDTRVDHGHLHARVRTWPGIQTS